MRALIAYDGTLGSEAVLEHLRRRRAGLPEDTEALVLLVSEFLIPEIDEEAVEDGLVMMPSRLRQLAGTVRKASAAALRQAHADVQRAAASVRKALPGWRVRALAVEGSASAQILEHARQWQSDLIVLGSHGRRPLERWLLGSVAHTVIGQAPCSVRVVRGRMGRSAGPASLVLGVDGSAGSRAAADSIAGRQWPAGSTARVVVAIDTRMASVVEPEVSSTLWGQLHDAHVERLATAADRAAETLRAAGLTTRVVIKAGDPKRVLAREAERAGADALFVGATNLTRVQRLLLGSVAAAVAVRCPCSVEIVRVASPRPRTRSTARAKSEPDVTVS